MNLDEEVQAFEELAAKLGEEWQRGVTSSALADLLARYGEPLQRVFYTALSK